MKESYHEEVSLLIFLGLSSLSSVFPQNEKRPEFFVGFSFESINTGITSSDLGATTTLDNRFKANGFNLSGAGYFTKYLGVAGDFSAHYNNRTDVIGTTSGQTNFSLYDFTGGPQVRFPGSTRFTPFAHALFGAARRNASETNASGTFTNNQTSFAMNFGGGVDYKFSNRLALRILQFDYNPILLRGRTINSLAVPNHTLQGFRFSTGIVFK